MNPADIGDPSKVTSWQERLVEWFTADGRSYPWRDTSDPYAILVSELMLQQTQIRTVLEKRYFENWLERFPTLDSLARADETEVLKAWQGLGYYNRARNLQRAARKIIADFDGKFPRNLESIESLPGVGRYTAGAVLSFAFDKPAPIVDGNIIRVLARVFQFTEPVDTTTAKKQIWEWAETLTSPSHPRIYNSAIMELGQRICSRDSPSCGTCPVRDHCESAGTESASTLPIKQKTASVTRKKESVVLLVTDNRILLERESGSRRQGLWKLPALRDSWKEDVELIYQSEYPITRYRVEMSVYSPTEKNKTIQWESEGLEWIDLDEELPPLGSPYLKTIEKFINSEQGNL